MFRCFKAVFEESLASLYHNMPSENSKCDSGTKFTSPEFCQPFAQTEN